MAAQPCPICGNAAAFRRAAAHGGWLIECAHCSAYEVTPSAWTLMEAAQPSDRVAALAWARAYNARYPDLLARPCVTNVSFEIRDTRRHR